MTAYGRCAASLRLGDGCQGTPGNPPRVPFHHPSLRWAASLGPWGLTDLRWSSPHPTTIHAKTQACECYSADGTQPSGVYWAKRQKRLEAGNAELHVNDPEDLPQTNPTIIMPVLLCIGIYHLLFMHFLWVELGWVLQDANIYRFLIISGLEKIC